MLKDFTIVIMHAGNASMRINIGRGCRQGYPIASLLFILCIKILLIKIGLLKYMEGFENNITLSVENLIIGLENVTQIIEEFGNLSGLRISKDKTQAMIFGHNSRTATPDNNNLEDM